VSALGAPDERRGVPVSRRSWSRRRPAQSRKLPQYQKPPVMLTLNQQSTVDSQPALWRLAVRGSLCPALADVAQPAEHLFCKQVVRGSSPLVSSGREDFEAISEGCPSGQREQTVNLPAIAFVGSNPTPSTRAPRSFGSPNAAARSAEWPTWSEGAKDGTPQAGVAQLVERQPSKLNVEGSSPFSRSTAPTTHRLTQLPT
jgi:hypothetical protein